ncbi:hypothetical protein Sjap_025541 [Stephania japonica]|uniref:Uncharacterized protein n=1 Tax=Stephania japonica TaxID=461633 RepID=A0AAP0E4H2_9MAGN
MDGWRLADLGLYLLWICHPFLFKHPARKAVLDFPYFQQYGLVRALDTPSKMFEEPTYFGPLLSGLSEEIQKEFRGRILPITRYTFFESLIYRLDDQKNYTTWIVSS